MRHALLTLLLFCVIAAVAPSHAQVTDNPELASIHRDDQLARADAANIDWSVVAREDAERRARVLALMRGGAMRTARDHYHAAMVFQHGSTLEDIRTAHALSSLAATLAPEEAGYRWLVAASWDRIMTTQLQPQWYGTQFRSDETGLFLYPVADGAVGDPERARLGVPPLAEIQARIGETAATMGQPVHPAPPTIEQLRRAQHAIESVTP